MITHKDELYHHGVKGQRWGVRRYQDPTGKLTAAGEKRYNRQTISPKTYSKEDKKWLKETQKSEFSRIKKEHRKELRKEFRKARIESRHPFREKRNGKFVNARKVNWEKAHKKMREIYVQYSNVFVNDLKSPSGNSIKFVENRMNYKKPKLVLTKP